MYKYSWFPEDIPSSFGDALTFHLDRQIQEDTTGDQVKNRQQIKIQDQVTRNRYRWLDAKTKPHSNIDNLARSKWRRAGIHTVEG